MSVSTNRSSWQEALSRLITDPKELFELLQLDETLLPAAYKAAKIFPLKVTHSFVARMQKNNPHDPLLRQVLPLDAELSEVDGYKKDPLQEVNTNPVPGLLHKYYGRVLVTLTSACAVHCRYCFRRHFPYAENNPGRLGWEKIFSYVRANDTIHEIILSGGDPLAVSDKLLNEFFIQLTTIPHVKTIRMHTRLPIVLPERITSQFIELITQSKLNIVIVIHANHPREINNEVKNALLKLKAAHVHLLNQSVLLKDVNDDVSILKELSDVLFAAGVLPYYLHVLDKVQGAAHFDIAIEKAQTLHAKLAAKLPGYLVPRLACEEPGALAKTLMSTAL